jgi:hypothetical protein
MKSEKRTLPDGVECIETYNEFTGGSETQGWYSYNVPTEQYEKDYWGKVIGLKADVTWTKVLVGVYKGWLMSEKDGIVSYKRSEKWSDTKLLDKISSSLSLRQIDPTTMVRFIKQLIEDYREDS